MSRPIRSPRQLYKVDAIKVPGANDTERSMLVKIKESVGDWLGISPVAYNDPIFNGVFTGSGLNQGKKYRKRLGGFRHASYTLVARTTFSVTELVRQANGTYQPTPRNVRTISIGFPKGHSVNEVVAWIGATNRGREVSGIRTPSGALVPMSSSIT